MNQISAQQGQRRDALALTRLYFVYFLSYGIYQPYLNLHFKRLGLSGTEIGALSALRPFTAMLIPPLVGYLADRYGQRRRMLAWILLGGVIPYYLILLSDSFLWLLATVLVFSVFAGPVIPMLDSNALDALDGNRTRYGLMRRWGSFGYMVAVVATGQLGEYLGIPVLLSVSGIALAVAGVMAWQRSKSEVRTVPEVAQTKRPWWAEVGTSWRDIVKYPGMPAFFLAGFLGWMASTTYYNFFSIYADELGMPEGLIGLAWGIAVVSEILMLSLSAKMLTRLGAKGLFATGLTAAAIRWTLYAVVRHPYVILALQTLHGFTFGALQAGAVTYLHAQVAPNRRSGAQTLWAALTGGVAGVAGAYLVGPLSDVVGLRPMFALSGALAMAGALVGWFGLKRVVMQVN